jgi:hypothetical protein
VRNMDLAGAVYRSEKIYFCAKSNLWCFSENM